MCYNFAMKIETIKTAWLENEFKQNTYVVSDEHACIIIDAGAPVKEIEQIIGSKKVFGVFITHCHYDHILYVEDYENELSCPIFMSEKGSDFLKNETLNVSALLSISKTFNLKKAVHLKGNETLHLKDFCVNVIASPGHSADSLCFLINSDTANQSSIMFCGDTFFAKAVGRTDLPTGNSKLLLDSLNSLMELDFDCAYPGHARMTTKQEQLENLSFWQNNL